MGGFWLLLPFLFIRFVLLAALNKEAVGRAAYFAPMQGREFVNSLFGDVFLWKIDYNDSDIQICGGEKAVMGKKQQKKFSLGIGVMAGVITDGYLRLISGDEGNLLVHMIVFLGSALIVSGIAYGLFSLWNMIFRKK